MTNLMHFLARVLQRLRTAYRRWRANQLMPSVLFGMNRHLRDDRSLVREDILDALDREHARRTKGIARRLRMATRRSGHALPPARGPVTDGC